MKAAGALHLLRELYLASKYRGEVKRYTLISRSGRVFLGRIDCFELSIIDVTRKQDTRKLGLGENFCRPIITEDGKKIICCTLGNWLKVWDVELISMEETMPLYCIPAKLDDGVEIGASNKNLYIKSDLVTSVYNIEDGRLLASSEAGAKHVISIQTPKGENLYATFHTDYPSDGDRIKIFDLKKGEKRYDFGFKFFVYEIKETDQRNEFLMTVFHPKVTEMYLFLLTIESSEQISLRKMISGITYAMVLQCNHTYTKTEFGALFAYAKSKEIVILRSDGIGVKISNLSIGRIDMNFTSDGRKLITRDRTAIRVFDVLLYPFWSQNLHSVFRGEQGKSINTLFYANRILSKRKKRKRSVISEIPREIMLHILSFVRRDY